MIKIIYGINPIYSLIKFNISLIKIIFLNKNSNNKRLLNIINHINNINNDKNYKHKIKIIYTNKFNINKKTLTLSNQGIMAIVKTYIPYNECYINNYKFNNNSIILILEKITDPHNLGACLRVALACKVSLVIVSNFNTAQLNNPIITKSMSGCIESIPIIKVNNINRIIKILKKFNLWILGTTTDKNTKCLFNCNFNNIGIAIILGSENLGLKKLTQKSCDELIHIPMINNNNSLNVSVATGIFLYEIIRQKFFNK